MLKVDPEAQQYTCTARADADTTREFPALISVGDNVLAIGGVFENCYMPTVSRYSVLENTWDGSLPQLNQARQSAGGCLLAGHIYIFAGWGYGGAMSSIEKIDAFSIDTAVWQLIQVS